jgi:hypothetical protein
LTIELNIGKVLSRYLLIYRVNQFKEYFIGLKEAAQIVTEFTLIVPEMSNQSERSFILHQKALIALFN